MKLCSRRPGRVRLVGARRQDQRSAWIRSATSPATRTPDALDEGHTGEIGPPRLVKEALRMRPSRIVGEGIEGHPMAHP